MRGHGLELHRKPLRRIREVRALCYLQDVAMT